MGIDATKGLGSVPGATTSNRTVDAVKPKREEDTFKTSETRVVKDEVVISKEAKQLTEAQASEAAKDTQKQLENKDFHLGLDPSFDKKV